MIFFSLGLVKNALPLPGFSSTKIRFAIYCLAFLFLSGCGSFHNQKTINLRDGSKVKVNFGFDESPTGEKIIVADFRNDRLVLKEAEVEKEVFDIWMGLKSEAERAGIDDGFIRYRFSTGAKNEAGKDVYELLLFAAEKNEAGGWTITRVN